MTRQDVRRKCAKKCGKCQSEDILWLRRQMMVKVVMVLGGGCGGVGGCGGDYSDAGG